MFLSFVIGSIYHFVLKKMLTKERYSLDLEIAYPIDGNILVYYDFGDNFNEYERVSALVKKGRNRISLPIENPRRNNLKRLRLDFGWNNALQNVQLYEIKLKSGLDVIFHIEADKISKQIYYLNESNISDADLGLIELHNSKKSFDPHIVFKPLNELIYPKWQRTLLLVLPWLVFLIIPLLDWLGKLNKEGGYGMLIVGLFAAAIPLKIAWVTFTSLLLMAYALLVGYKKRYFQFGLNQIALILFFLTPLLFLGEGDASKLAIPFGFVLFALIGGLLDFSDHTDEIKKIYITVFFVVMSISMVSWLLLMLYYGYYYAIGLDDYFVNIKTSAHTTMYWLYYSHTTFLSFFLLIGGLFCLELYEKRQITKSFGLTYALFGFCTLILLGSRFALFLSVLVPFLYQVPIKKLSRLLIPIWAVFFTGIVYFVSRLDAQREQLWNLTWGAFKDKIWLGHGTGTSNAVLPEHLLIDKGGIETLMKVNHSHNQFLTYLIENGLLGVLLFLIAFFLLYYQFAKQGDKTMLLISFMILMLMIIESPFKTTTSLYVIAFLLSVCNLPQKTLVRTEANDF